MHQNILTQTWYSRSAIQVAPELLGCKIHRKLPNNTIISGIIVEVEAYLQSDPACHAYKGYTKRNAVMFGPAGFSYVYFIYGMHFCLNIVTGNIGSGEAILLRGVDFTQNVNLNIKSGAGPGKLCKIMQIDKSCNGLPLYDKTDNIWITQEKLETRPVIQTTRVGISKAKEFLWRWYIADNLGVSRK